MAKTKKRTLTFGQTFWLMIALVAMIAGLGLATLGFLRDYLALPYDQNWIRIAENAMNEFLATDMSWILWGSLLMVIGATVFGIWTHRLATIEELAKEKALRRSQRLQDATITE